MIHLTNAIFRKLQSKFVEILQTYVGHLRKKSAKIDALSFLQMVIRTYAETAANVVEAASVFSLTFQTGRRRSSTL